MIPPVAMRYEGEGQFIASHRIVADRHFVIGERYTMVQHEQRSAASHAHYFAAVHEAWMNIPEGEADRFADADALRKFALISTGYRDERSIVAASKAEAQRIAAFIRPMDTYAVVTVSEAVVRVYTAQSQSMRAMGKARFQQSKQDVLDWLANLIGVSPDSLSSQGKAA